MTQAPQGSFSDGGSEGFTLIEVMVAVLILGIAMGVGATAFARRNAAPLPDFVALQMQAVLQKARRDAILTGSGKVFSVDIDKRIYTYPSGSVPIELPEGMSLRMTTSREFQSSTGRYSVWFNPDGSSSGSQIVLGDGKHSDATIEVHWLTGTPRIVTGTGN